ncbi:MAG: HNH endonuclease [Terriglobia bacterium]
MPRETKKDVNRRRVPTAADYVQAFKSLTPLPPSYVGMLQFHYRQPRSTATAGAMAEAVGFKNFNAASLHYGKLAGLVGERLNWRPQEEGKVKLKVLAEFDKRAGHWHWVMRKEVAEALNRLGMVGSRLDLLPGEMPEKITLREGAIYRVTVNAYERNPEARRLCLAHYGTSCVVCGFNYKTAYGLDEDFIHVHHIRMLAEIGTEYTVDPVRDLRPVCANCHSVIHLKTPPYSIGELKTMLGRRRERKQVARTSEAARSADDRRFGL